MGPEAIVTVAGVGVIVVVLAAYLTLIAYQLTRSASPLAPS